MTHVLHLAASPFRLIREGRKTIELRLYDEKRKRIRTGDTLLFVSAENSADTMEATVTGLYVFDSFDALYRALPLEQCGYSAEETASPDDMLAYYSQAQIAQNGVVGIAFMLRETRGEEA